MTDDALEPREAVLEYLLDPGHEPGRRDELRSLIDRDPAAVAELHELERVDDLLRTAGPMLEPSDDLMLRVLAVPDEPQPEASVDLPWEAASIEDAGPPPGYDDSLEGAIPPPPPPDGPTLLADLMPPPRSPRRGERTSGSRRERDRGRDRGGLLRNIVVWRAATVAFAAATLALAVVAFTGDDEKPSQQAAAAPTTVTVPADDSVSGATVPVDFAAGEPGTASLVAETASPEGRRIHLRIEGLAPTPKRIYTVWVARAPQRRIPLGSFKQDAEGVLDIVVTIPADLPPTYKGIWVTREPQTGRKGWSTDWVLKSKLS